MEDIRNGENPAAAQEPPRRLFLQADRRNLAVELHRLGLATAATAVGGLVEQLVGDAQLVVVFFLVVILFGAVGTIYVGSRVEVEREPATRWREAGVAVNFLCSLLFVAAVSLVGSVDYSELALSFLDN